MNSRILSEEYSRCILPADLECIAPVLKQMKDFCCAHGLRSSLWQEIELAAAEGLNNAILHGSKGRADAQVQLQWTWRDEILQIEITDPGDFMPGTIEATLPDDPLAESGRGGFLISSLMDKVEHLRSEAGHILRLEKVVGNQTWKTAEAAEMESTISALMEELSRSYEEVSSLIHFAEELAASTSLEEFLNRTFTPLLGLINGDSAYIRFLASDKKTLELAKPAPADFVLAERIPVDAESAEAMVVRSGKSMTIEDCESLREGDPLNQYSGCLFICPVLFRTQILGCFIVMRSRKTPYFSAGELELVRVVADLVGIVSITNRLQRQRQAQQLALRELEIAASIQQSLLPRKFPENSNYRIFGLCHSARQVGGDYFDVLEVSPEAILFVIADVMGKGVPAALIATVMRTAIHARLDLAAQPARLLTEVNHQIASDLTQLDMFITAQVAYLSLKDNTLLISNAGHCPLLHFQAENNGIRLLLLDGLPLGVIDNYEYREARYQVECGDRFVFLTDGLYEVENPDGEMLGLDKLVKQVQSIAAATPMEFCDQVVDFVRNYSAAQPAYDDRTLLTIQRIL